MLVSLPMLPELLEGISCVVECDVAVKERIVSGTTETTHVGIVILAPFPSGQVLSL